MEKTFLLSSGVRQGCPHSITFIQSCMGGSSQYKKKKKKKINKRRPDWKKKL